MQLYKATSETEQFEESVLSAMVPLDSSVMFRLLKNCKRWIQTLNMNSSTLHSLVHRAAGAPPQVHVLCFSSSCPVRTDCQNIGYILLEVREQLQASVNSAVQCK